MVNNKTVMFFAALTLALGMLPVDAAADEGEAASSTRETAADAAPTTDGETTAAPATDGETTAAASSVEMTPEGETAASPEETVTAPGAAPTSEEAQPSGTQTTDDLSATAAPPPSPDELNIDSGERTYGYAGPRRMLFLLGPGFGFSFFGCKEINDYLESWIAEQDAYEADQSSAKMFLAFQPRFSLTFGPIEYVQIQFLGELAWAPKIIKVIGGSSESFHYVRYSTGGTVSGHIPLAQGRRSISFGAGALFNVLKFRDYTEYAPGYRGVFAFRFYGRKAFTPEIFVEFNWIKADTGADPDGNIPEAIGELSYVSGTIGANFYFKLIEKQ